MNWDARLMEQEANLTEQNSMFKKRDVKLIVREGSLKQQDANLTERNGFLMERD